MRAHWIACKVALLREAKELYEEAMISIGARAADDRYQEACTAEEDARLAIILHQPSNDAEARERAAHLATCEPFVEGWCEEESFQEKLYAKLGIPIADGGRPSLKAVL